MTTLPEIYIWTNRYDDAAPNRYRGRRSYLSRSTQIVLDAMHNLMGGDSIERIWDLNRHMLSLCQSNVYSKQERAEALLECAFIATGLGNSCEAANLFDKAAGWSFCHNKGIALWGKGINMWRIPSEHEGGIVAWQTAIQAFDDCYLGCLERINNLGRDDMPGVPDTNWFVRDLQEQIAWYLLVINQMHRTLDRQFRLRGI